MSLRSLELRSESEIQRRWQPESHLRVSVFCTTYNHAPYIEDALRGFLIQETDFPFEILIHDDASTDGTSEIVRDFAGRYPGLIRPTLQGENQHSKGNNILRILLAQAKGDYFAFCEGDDYWIDPQKLALQVMLLDDQQDCSMSCTGAVVDRVGGRRTSINYSGLRRITPDMCLCFDYFMATASLVFRREVFSARHETWMDRAFAGDFIWKYKALTLGDIGFIDRVTCVYRKSVPGSWTQRKITPALVRREMKDNIRGINYLSRCVNVSPDSIRAKRQRVRHAYALGVAYCLPLSLALGYLLLTRRAPIRTALVLLKHKFTTR